MTLIYDWERTVELLTEKLGTLGKDLRSREVAGGYQFITGYLSGSYRNWLRESVPSALGRD